MSDAPDASFVIPAREEAPAIGRTLASIEAQRADAETEVIVVDGHSRDATSDIAREWGATVLEGPGRGIGPARHAGAERASGTWLAFVDADTRLRPDYLETMLGFVRERGLAAASSRCRMVGPARVKVMEWTINHVFPRLDRPILPGFNCFVDRATYFEAGGFPAVPNEDTAFSRALGRQAATDVCPAVLVENSGRRIVDDGLTATGLHYLRLDLHRLIGRE